MTLTNHSRRAALVPVLSASALIAAGLVFAAPAAAASITVNCPTNNLQLAINAADPGATLAISGWCEGTFTINKALTLTGAPGATLSADGGGVVLTTATAALVTVKSLEITDGAAGEGAGISASGGPLTLDHVLVDDNDVNTNSSIADGGGVYYDGSGLRITHSTIRSNQAQDLGNTAQLAQGGGLWAHGPVVIDDSVFADNRALQSTAVQDQGEATGGGAYISGGPVTIDHSSFTGNVLRATVTTPDDSAFGGSSGAGLHIEGMGIVAKVTNSTFAANVASAAAPFAGGSGGGAVFESDEEGNLTMSHDAFTGNDIQVQVTGSGSPYSSGAGFYANVRNGSLNHVTANGNSIAITTAEGANARGGGASINMVGGAVRASTFSANTLRVMSTNTSTAANASSSGAGVYFATGTKAGLLSATAITGNKAIAEAGNGSAQTFGGGIVLLPLGVDHTSMRVVNTTIAHNSAQSTSTTASTKGGGVWSVAPTVKFQFDTIVANTALSSTGSAATGGGYRYDGNPTTAVSFEGTILAGNSAKAGANCSGSVVSAGYNAIGSTSKCTVKKKSTDQVGLTTKRLKLGKLAGNGGPTKTIALGAGSIALDRVPRHACRAIVTTDQRGVSRPQGRHPATAKCDEGAYERTVKH